MKKWLIPLIGLTLSLAVAGIVTGFTLSAGSGTPAQEPSGQVEEPSGSQPPIRSDEGIDPDECNWIHNITACNDTLVIAPDEEGTIEPDFGEDGPDLASDRDVACQGVAITSDGQVSCLGLDEGAVMTNDEPGGHVVEPQTPVTSIDDIDPNVCHAIHNINACTAEELEELGMAPITGSIAVGENHAGVEVAGKPEPLFVDGEPQYEVQSFEEAVEQDCGLAGGTVYVSTDGEVGCVIVHDLEDGGEGETKEQPLVVMPQDLPAAE